MIIKKNWLLKLIFFMMLCGFVLTSCSDKYGDWQRVIIPGAGSIRVPKEWVVTQEDIYWYLTDKPIHDDFNIYLVGAIDENGRGVSIINLFEGIEFVETLESQVFSGSGSYWKTKYIIDGLEKEKSGIGMYKMDLISWDDLVDRETLLKIAESYSRD